MVGRVASLPAHRGHLPFPLSPQANQRCQILGGRAPTVLDYRSDHSLAVPGRRVSLLAHFRHEGRFCACRCEGWTCSKSDSISFMRSCLAYPHPPTGAFSHSGWGLLSLPSPHPHSNFYCMWSPYSNTSITGLLLGMQNPGPAPPTELEAAFLKICR